jgi:DNA (cytosine-5)-methyltransferase 1
MVRSNIQNRNKMKINHLDLFSGIGGFHLGFERAGYEITSYFSEIDKHAIAVYKHQFPTSTYVGSVTDVRGTNLPNINIITFGSPCQDFSLAGKRKGMEGQRSSLVLEAIRLISECRPSVFIWENVKGTFSSNDGADFWAIIQAFADIGGYRLEWQLLNTSWFLPQNRERIYLVGYSTATGGDWRGVFPIAENNKSNTEQHGVEIVGHRGTGGQQGFIYGEAGIAPTLSACCYKDPTKVQVKQIGTRLDSNSGTQPYQQDRVYDADGIVPALNQGKSDLILRVKSATNSGYEEATSGDTINLSQPNSETRRGRVGKQKAQTLETSCNQAVVGNYRIRRLTPIECERLQGFPDQHTAYGNYDGEVKPMSNTQRYRQCGNAVTVDVVAAVAKKCLSLFN